MAIDRLPTSTTLPYYEFEIELDEVEFKVEFRYNDRDSSWYMTLKDTDDVVLRAGIRVVLEWSLLRLWQEDTRPEGEIISVNQGEVLAPPTLNQLGAEVVLTYVDAAELAELAASGG